MIYEVWAEGYATNGESSGAFLMGSYEGETFDDAVLECMMDKRHNPQSLFKYSLSGHHTYWGCRLFDNEYDARRDFN